MATETLAVSLILRGDQYKREAKAAATATGQIAREAQNATKQGNFLTRTFSKWGDEIKTFVALRAARAIKDFVGQSIQAASALNESLNATKAVFGSASATIQAFGEGAAQAAGLSQREFQQLATVAGAALTNLGLGLDDAANHSIRLTTRAADMASVFDTDVNVALEAINSSLAGQQRPLRQFGVNLDDATIRAKAVQLGLADTTAEVDKHGKAVATLELIYEQTASAQGDFARTSDEFANSQRRAAAEFENAQARFGQTLQGPLTTGINLLSGALEGLQLIFGDIHSIFTGSDNIIRQTMRWNEALTSVTDAMAFGREPALAFQNALLHLAEAGELSAGQVKALAAAANVSIEDFDLFATSLEEMAAEAGVDAETVALLGSAIREAGIEATASEHAHRELGEELDEEAKAAEAAARSHRGLIDAYKEAANPIFAAQKALDRYRDAQEKLKKVQEDSKSTAKDIAEAQLDVASAAIEAESALSALGGGNITAGINAIAAALGISDKEARDFLVTLGLLDGRRVTTIIETQFLTRRLTSGGVQERQHGGPVSAGHPYIVGERGPELFIPQQSGRVLPNSMATTTGTAGSVWNISLEGTGAPQVDAQRVGAMASVLRRMESN